MIRSVTFVVAAFAAVVGAAAQAQPARNANVYDGTHHQPTPSGTGAPAVGTGPVTKTPPPTSPGGNNAVDPLGAKLLHDEAVDPPRPPQSSR